MNPQGKQWLQLNENQRQELHIFTLKKAAVATENSVF